MTSFPNNRRPGAPFSATTTVDGQRGAQATNTISLQTLLSLLKVKMVDSNLLKPVEALVLPSPSSNQRLSGPANKAAVNAEPFAYDDAVALHCQIEVFQRSYQKEGYKVPDNAVRWIFSLGLTFSLLSLLSVAHYLTTRPQFDLIADIVFLCSPPERSNWP